MTENKNPLLGSSVSCPLCTGSCPLETAAEQDVKKALYEDTHRGYGSIVKAKEIKLDASSMTF